MSKSTTKAAATATELARADDWVLHCERTCLGAALRQNDLVRGALSELKVFHFLLDDHREIFRTELEYAEEAIPFDAPVLAGGLLERDRKLKVRDPLAYLEDLTDGVVPDERHIQHLAENIIRAWRKRELRRLAEHVESEALKPESDPGQVCQLIEISLARISPHPQSSSILGCRHGPEAPVLDDDALHGIAGGIVKTILPHSEADAATLLLHFLVGFGILIGRSPYCQVESTKHYGNLFCAAVGVTSKGRKGTAKDRVRELLRLVDEDWARKRIQSGLSSGEGLINAVADHGDEKTDRRLLVVQGELASVLKVVSREGNTLSPIIRECWDTGSLHTMVKNNPLHVHDAHIGIISHMTGDELRRCLTATEVGNGFANRFLTGHSARSKCLPEGGNLKDEALEELARNLQPAIRHARTTNRVTRDEEAGELWASVYPVLSDGQPGLLGAVTSRAEAQVLRLSMLYALLDSSGAIRLPHLKAALAVWDYCAKSAAYIFGSALGDPVADPILEALRQAGSSGLTRTQINGDVLGRNRNAMEISRALAFLQERGLAHSETVPDTGGRCAEVWKIGPRYERRQEGKVQ